MTQALLPRQKLEREFALDPTLVLYLPLNELDGVTFAGKDHYGRLCTATGSLWTPLGRSFDRVIPHYLTLPTSDNLNFTTHDFSMIARVNLTLVATAQPFSRGLSAIDGYLWDILGNGQMRLRTNQAAASQTTTSAVGAITALTWTTIGFSRSGTSVRLFRDGKDVTDTPAAHTDPFTSARTARIGIYDDLVSNAMDGIMEFFLAFRRALSAGEHLSIHMSSV